MAQVNEETVERHVEAGKTEENPGFMCIDGRGKQAGYGVLGGSAGLAIRSLGAYLACVQVDIRELAEERLLRSMARFLDWFDQGIVRLEGHTADGYDHPHKPGCGYCGLLLENPVAMHVSSPVTVAVLRYVEPEDRLAMLFGEHQEVGVIVFTDEHAPAAVPLVGDEQVFVYHARREAAFYDQHAAAICEQLNKLTGASVELAKFREALDEITELHLKISVKALAHGLPVHETRVGSEKLVTR